MAICVICKKPILPHEDKEEAPVDASPGAPMEIRWAHARCLSG